MIWATEKDQRNMKNNAIQEEKPSGSMLWSGKSNLVEWKEPMEVPEAKRSPKYEYRSTPLWIQLQNQWDQHQRLAKL